MSKQFLNRYFATVHEKLQADALLYNDKIPHSGLKGGLNELAIADVLRDFLPRRFGVETNALIVDRHGALSNECDVVIYDDERFPRYFRKVFPVELVYAVVEVKTTLTSQEAENAKAALRSVNQLDFRPALTNYWQTRTVAEKLLHYPPICSVFAYRTDAVAFETFARWFPQQLVYEGTRPLDNETRSYIVSALDQGVMRFASGDGYPGRWATVAGDARVGQGIRKRVHDREVLIDPAKSLFYFLEQLWTRLSVHGLHPGFDIRSYLDDELDVVVEVPTLSWPEA